MRQAVEYLERRCQVMRTTLLDNGLVVRDETDGLDDKDRRGFVDQRYARVERSKKVHGCQLWSSNRSL